MNQNKKMTLLKKTLMTAGLFFFILLSLECGLRLKASLKGYLANENLALDARTVLMIGDSVLGGGEVKNSIYNELKSNLESKDSSPITLIDKIQQGNYSSQVNYTIDEVIKKYHPKLSIVLLGNSDFIVLSEKMAKQTYLPLNYVKDFIYRTYLFKLYISFSLYLKISFIKKSKVSDLQQSQEFREDPKSPKTFQKQELLYKAFQNGNITCTEMAKLAELRVKFLGNVGLEVLQNAEKCDIRKMSFPDQFKINYSLGRAYNELRIDEKTDYFFNKALAISPNSLSLLGHMYWRAEGKKNCSEMLKFFDDILTQVEPRGKMLWSLRYCFIKNDKFKEGVQFFENLSTKLKANKELSLLIAQSLSGSRGTNISIASELSANRDYYLSMLNFYKLKSMYKEANELFLKKDLYEETNEVSIDLKNFRRALGKLINDGGEVIVLQYPNQSDWPVLKAIAPFGSNVTFISLSSILEKSLGKYNIFQLLADDFLHVTPLGAKIIADELNSKIRKSLK